jgi:transposase
LIGDLETRSLMLDMEMIVRRQNQEHCASITCMIRHYVARRAKVIEDHPHNAAMSVGSYESGYDHSVVAQWPSGATPHRSMASDRAALTWAWPALTDIHHQGFAPGRMSDHGEHGRKKPRRRRSFAPEFKAEIVELCLRGDRSVGQVAKDFDLTETAVREWVRQAERDAGTRVDGGLTSAERQELVELRRECRRLREDVEILKRATAFFAKETR